MGTLRFLLALCVVVTHAPGSKLLGITLLSGITAVQGFYIISGFLITMVLTERSEYRNSVRNFYLSRYLRLWPAYIVIAVLSFLLIKQAWWTGVVAKMDFAAQAFIVFSNAAIFFQDLFLFFAIDPGGTYLYPTAHFATEPGRQLSTLLMVPQAWTLGVELAFYLIAPFFCRSAARLAALFTVGLTTRIALTLWAPSADPWLYRFAPAEMLFFALGGLAYFAGIWIQKRASATLMMSAGICCMVALTALVFHNPFPDRIEQTLLILNPWILAAIVLAAPFLFSVSRRWSLDSMIGELSYPMYICHLFIAEFISVYCAPLWSYGNLPYVAVTLAVSLALLWLVVLPTDRIRKRFGARMPIL